MTAYHAEYLSKFDLFCYNYLCHRPYLATRCKTCGRSARESKRFTYPVQGVEAAELARGAFGPELIRLIADCEISCRHCNGRVTRYPGKPSKELRARYAGEWNVSLRAWVYEEAAVEIFGDHTVGDMCFSEEDEEGKLPDRAFYNAQEGPKRKIRRGSGQERESQRVYRVLGSGR